MNGGGPDRKARRRVYEIPSQVYPQVLIYVLRVLTEYLCKFGLVPCSRLLNSYFVFLLTCTHHRTSGGWADAKSIIHLSVSVIKQRTEDTVQNPQVEAQSPNQALPRRFWLRVRWVRSLEPFVLYGLIRGIHFLS